MWTQQLFTSVPTALVLILALVCAATDLAQKRIYNFITYPALLAGLILGAILGGPMGFLHAFGGAAAGFAPAFVLFALGGLGGGDVKLLAAVGALLGATGVTEVFLLSFVLGALFAFGWLAWRGEMFAMLGAVVQRFLSVFVPRWRAVALARVRLEVRFGVAIAAAVLATVWDKSYGVLGGW